MPGKLKLYWSTDYPSNLYMIDKGVVYALRTQTNHDDDVLGFKTADPLQWWKTVWSVDNLTTPNRHGFHYIGEI